MLFPFSMQPLLVASLKSGYVFFVTSSEYFLISLVSFFPFTHVLLRSMLFNFQTLGASPGFLMFSSFILFLVKEYILYDFSLLKFIVTCFGS